MLEKGVNLSCAFTNIKTLPSFKLPSVAHSIETLIS